jgi:H+/Cl- antiporter ClcA
VGTAVGIAFQEIVSFLLGTFDQPVTYAVKVAVLAAAYNAVLTPIVYPLLRRLSEGSRTRKVVRF